MITDDSRGKEIETREQDVHRMCSDLNASQDFVGGIMKIVPSVVDVSLIFQNKLWGGGRGGGLIQERCYTYKQPSVDWDREKIKAQATS